VVVFPATVLVWMNCFLPETGVAKLRLSTHPVSVERNQDLLFLLEISASIFAGCRTPVYIPDGRLENVFRLVSMVVLLPIHWEAVQSICLDGGAFLFFLSHIILLSHARLRFYIRSTPGLVVTKYFGRSKLAVFYQAFTRSFRSYFFFVTDAYLIHGWKAGCIKAQPLPYFTFIHAVMTTAPPFFFLLDTLDTRAAWFNTLYVRYTRAGETPEEMLLQTQEENESKIYVATRPESCCATPLTFLFSS